MPLSAYWLATESGELHRFGLEHTKMSLDVDASVVAISATADRSGCLVLDDRGRVHCYGSARHSGDLTQLGRSIIPVDISATPRGYGYWIIDTIGSVYAFGGAEYCDGVPQVTNDASEPVCVRANPAGSGYWIMDRRGGVCAFGSASFNGPLAEYVDTRRLEIVDFAPAPRGKGYWMVDSIGGVFALGDAEFLGAPTEHGSVDTVALIADGDGYLVIDRRGAILSFGEAVHRGSLVGLGERIIAAG